MNKLVSYFVALLVGLLAVAPPINYDIPLVINHFYWIYMVIASALIGFFLLRYEFSIYLKILLVYLFLNCFFSQAPALSFNAFVLIVLSVAFFLVCKTCDFKPILDMVQAAFWLQVVIAFVQYFGKDTLMSFEDTASFASSVGLAHHPNPKGSVFFGTVFQQMRLSSLFAIMSPLLLIRSKWYIIPIIITAYALGSLGYTYAVALGLILYVFFKIPEGYRSKVIFFIILFCLICSYNSWTHIYVETVEGRLPVWWVTIKSWVLDTTGSFGNPDIFGISQTGPFDLKRFLLGHGMDTFMPLFPIYKHDPNPFPQAHNDWLQIPWEVGIFGFLIFFGYCLDILKRLYRSGEKFLICGISIISVNMFFHFPSRMTQTVLLMICFIAYCESKLKIKMEDFSDVKV